MELINPLHRAICFDFIRFHSIAENIINEYILILSYLVLFHQIKQDGHVILPETLPLMTIMHHCDESALQFC
jgi:hypothetical protein